MQEQNVTFIIIGGLMLDNYPFRQIMQDFSCIFIDINNLDYSQVHERILSTLKRDNYSYKKTIIGYSTGGLIALSLYATIKPFINKLILLNSSPYFTADNNWHGILTKDYMALYKRLETLSIKDFYNYFSTLCFYPQSREQHYKMHKLLSKENIMYWLKFLQDNDLRSIINNHVSIPLLMLYSDQDALVKDNWQKNKNITQYTLQNSSHANPDQDNLVMQIERFINE